ncbi:hypothetical protein HK405_001928, partial [Cladochytrium tenue]
SDDYDYAMAPPPATDPDATDDSDPDMAWHYYAKRVGGVRPGVEAKLRSIFSSPAGVDGGDDLTVAALLDDSKSMNQPVYHRGDTNGDLASEPIPKGSTR